MPDCLNDITTPPEDFPLDWHLQEEISSGLVSIGCMSTYTFPEIQGSEYGFCAFVPPYPQTLSTTLPRGHPLGCETGDRALVCGE